MGLTSLRAPQCMEDIVTSLTSFEIYDLMDVVNDYIADAEAIITEVATYLDGNFFLDGLKTLINNVSTHISWFAMLIDEDHVS